MKMPKGKFWQYKIYDFFVFYWYLFTVMDERINKRADKMIEEGLVEELLDFHQQYNVSRMKENR